MVKKFQGDIYLVGHNRHMIKSCKNPKGFSEDLIAYWTDAALQV